MRKLLNVLILVTGVYLIISSVYDINSAVTWLEMFRGLFWLSIGAFAFYSGLDFFYGQKGGEDAPKQ